METFKAYEEAALRTASQEALIHKLLNGVLGLNGEAGEVAEVFKKHLFQGQELNSQSFIEEIGDVLWYCAMLANALDVSLSDIAKANIEKLKKRYPEQFDQELEK